MVAATKLEEFVYEFGKVNPKERGKLVDQLIEFLNCFDDITTSTTELFNLYPYFKMGDEARTAKQKSDNLKPTKKRD